ncbi:uncharacterized protein LOC123504190 [Portunus trituberculatus]|uniref:uncharacterized protein LOC123504190 n=1 Tax=Portunus trituberculatus TaxID=210409 RepID=UPI001E1CEE3D|nr:uncharacterized protein LOC123504190 [Portunus trituberculatus]
MSHLSNFNRIKGEPVHYFTGRVRAFWKDLVFFSDARNVAVIEIHDLYINGKRAFSKDLSYLEDLVRNSDWKKSPELHSYVSEYPYDIPTPWPYQLSGKALWKAKCAWLGWIPNCIKNANINNIVHMPISYYSGLVKKIFMDNILFGDMRNDIMVSSDNVYVNGERGFKRNTHDSTDSSWIKIRAYIIRLDVLTNMHLGPLPDLPIWPKDSLCSDMWVAKFAWFGDMPNEVRDQIGRYHVIRMNQWSNICHVPWKDKSAQQVSANKESWKDRYNYDDKQRVPEKEIRSCHLLVPTEQPAGYMRGALLLADSKQALMTSYVDLIAFSKDNFYVNGQKFKDNYDLCFFFKNRRVCLNAWVIPFDKPKVIFNINVAWHAVCVWYGSPPKDLEHIKNSACGKTVDDLVESPSSVTLTHFLGNVYDLHYDSGELMSKAGLDQSVKVSFSRKVVYMYGRKFNTDCSLLDNQQVLQNNIWSVLAYPVLTDMANGIPHYQALVIWQYEDQHSMHVISKIITEFVEETKNCCKRKEKVTQHMSGYIAKISDNYGIMKVESASVDNIYLYFRKEVLYIDGKLFPKNICLPAKEQGRQCNAECKTMLPKDVDGYQVTMEATLLWIGRKPSLESRKPAPDFSGNPQHVQNTDCSDYNEHYAANMQTESYTRPGRVLHIAEGVKVGSVFIVDKHCGLIICSNIIAVFSSDTFYVNGNKLSSNDSLDNFCSENKITVKAKIVTLKAPKIVLNCAVMCEAICTWIGQEPSDLTRLQREHLIKRNKSCDIPKISHKSLLYFVGKISPVSKDVALLASSTPEGTSKILFSKENIFINGSVVDKDDIFEKWKRTSSHSWWSVLACPISPKYIMGHSVCYSAVAVWDMSHHHKMRKVLPLVACQVNDKPDKQEYCTNGKLSGPKKSALVTQEASLHTLQLKECSKEKLLQVKGSSQLNDSSVIVSNITKECSKDETIVSSVDLALSPENEFCGKHIRGHVVKKTGRGGIALWRSQIFEGLVFIEFNTETLYHDLEPIVEIWRVNDVKSRACNFYVIPVPHHRIGEYVVSLKATCGWMGKKPSHLPSPGTQLLSKIDLSSVHVTQPNDMQGSESEMVQVSQEYHQKGNTVNERNLAKNHIQLELPVTGKFKNMMQETKNEEASRTGCGTRKPAQPVLPSRLPNADECGKIWEDKNKKQIHHQGSIVEVHSSVGQLKGEDGSLHYFPRESCHLYGVPLLNVELWHVLAEDDPVLYTVIELVPGMIKVQKVWLGALELPNKKITNEHILAWCQMKLVPDGARDILISQLEMQ